MIEKVDMYKKKDGLFGLFYEPSGVELEFDRDKSAREQIETALYNMLEEHLLWNGSILVTLRRDPIDHKLSIIVLGDGEGAINEYHYEYKIVYQGLNDEQLKQVENIGAIRYSNEKYRYVPVDPIAGENKEAVYNFIDSLVNWEEIEDFIKCMLNHFDGVYLEQYCKSLEDSEDFMKTLFGE